MFSLYKGIFLLTFNCTSSAENIAVNDN